MVRRRAVPPGSAEQGVANVAGISVREGSASSARRGHSRDTRPRETTADNKGFSAAPNGEIPGYGQDRAAMGFTAR
jgi:hypothetical protein